ncbi:MAG: PAS domain-containing protein, partial [Candidatus Margulisbacteria bacterium]|nr:PAS domain-containing protein [Candidatus Margulisiibacteriota bacterium]
MLGGGGTLLLIFLHRIEHLFPLYIGLAALAMGWLVYSAAPGKRINLTYLFLTGFLYVFALSLFLFSTAKVPSEALFWLRAGAISGLATAVAFFYFALIFPKVESRPTIPQLVFWVVWGGLSLSLSFTGLLFEKAVITPDGNGFNLGLGSPIYLFFMLATAGVSIMVLRRKQQRYFGTSRLQVGYILLGGVLALSVPLLCNLVLPVMGFNQLLGYGPFFLLTLAAFGYYTILKHRLMSLEIVIRQITVYTTSALLSAILFLIIVLLGQAYFAGRPGFGLLTFSAFDALLIAILYQPLVSITGRIADRLFFRGRYDYRNTILKISREIASVIKLEGLTKLIAMSFVKTMEVSEISFLLLDQEREHFRSIPMSIPRYKRIEIDVESPIVSWLSIMQDVLVRDEIEDELDRQMVHTGGVLAGTSDLEEVRDEMDRLGIPVWVPIISKDQLIGIIALGNKLSGDIMTAEDIGLLGTLASQTAVALDNARLYAQVVNMKDYNEEILQSMVSGVMTVDQKERIVTFNQMAEKITGRKIIEVLGKSCEEIWGEDSLLNRIVAQSFKEHCFNNHEAVLSSHERGGVPVSIASTLLRDHDGKKIGVLITIL